MSPFLRGMTGQQIGVGRPSLAQMLAPATRPTPTAAGPTMTAAQPLDIAGLRRQVLAQSAAPTAPQSRQALMAKYGLAPTAPAPKPSPMQRLSAALPASGTPQMAGLGAVGRTMLELSGYQPVATAPSLGQILARSAEAGIGAMEKRKAAEQAAAEKKAAAKRQEMLDAITLGEFNIKRRKDARAAAAEGQPTKPYEIYDVATGRKVFVRDVPDGKGGFTTEQVGGVAAEKPEKAGKPSGFVSVYDKEGNFVENVREDSEKADNYAQEGYRIVESTSISGTKEDVGFGLSSTDYSKRVLKAFDATESINKLENVKQSFDENFLRIGGKVDLAIAKGADWGNFATDKQKDLIRRVSEWQLDAWTQVNETIKAITGAQMSEPEAKRIMKQLPDPREAEFFKISSPTQYKAKLERALQEAKLAVARQQYFLKNGLEPIFEKTERTEKNPRGYNVFYETDDGVLTLDGTKILMKKEASRLAEKYKDLPNEEKRAAIKSDMQSLFGLGV